MTDVRETRPRIQAERIGDGPVVHPGLASELGGNINGPSLVAAPDWCAAPARYLLYFAHHEGRSIRLALADRLEGPWRIHPGGVLQLAQTPLPQDRPEVSQPDWAVEAGVDGLYPHIASPEVHADPAGGSLVMYLHGLDETGGQVSLRATSPDGVHWSVCPSFRQPEVYLRVFSAGTTRYAIALGGQILRQSGDGSFVPGPHILGPDHRHPAILPRQDRLHVVSSRIGDAPERLVYSSVELGDDWRGWRAGEWQDLLTPQTPWEGADLPIQPSRVGTARHPEHALRDPCFFEENGQVFMVYAVAGEQGLALARLTGL